MNTLLSLAPIHGIEALTSAIAPSVTLTTGTGTLGSVRTVAATVLVLIGAFFLLVGTVGLLRMPNMYNRMHATTKATTIGVVSMFLAAFVVYGPGGAGLIAVIAIVFLSLTIPTGAHLLLQSALRMGVPFEEDVKWPDEE